MKVPDLAVHLPKERALMNLIAPKVDEIHEQHLARREKRGLWQPIDLIPVDALPADISPELKASLVLNLLTEEGLPYFLALLVKHLGEGSAIARWYRTWTAEEDRHGAALTRYLDIALSHEERRAVEVMQHGYLEQGFWPDWGGSPVRLICYVVLQEKATQYSHGNIAGYARSQDETLQNMMAKISFEEKLHHGVYLGFLKALYEHDASTVITSLYAATKTFSMPGENMPEFDGLAIIQRKMNIFGPRELANIISKVWDDLSISQATRLTPQAEAARDALSKHKNMLYRLADRYEGKGSETVTVSFLGDETITFQ